MRIDGNIPGNIQGQAINLSDLKGILEKVNIGDVVKAQILEITSDDVLLKIFDSSTVKTSTASNTSSTTVKASTMSNIDGKPGDFLNLLVKEKKDNQIILETVKNNTSKPTENDNEIKVQLKGMGLKADPKNIDIIKELKTNNLPVNNETLNKIVDLVAKFKDLTPSKAAFLLSGNMEPEEKNISALNQLVDGKAKIAVKLNDIFKAVNSIEATDVLKNIENKLTDIKTSIPNTIKPEQKLPETVKVNLSDVNKALGDEKSLKDMITNIVNDNLKNSESKDIKSNIISKPIIDKLFEAFESNDANADFK